MERQRTGIYELRRVNSRTQWRFFCLTASEADIAAAAARMAQQEGD
jgi:hypothetical protein